MVASREDERYRCHRGSELIVMVGGRDEMRELTSRRGGFTRSRYFDRSPPHVTRSSPTSDITGPTSELIYGESESIERRFIEFDGLMIIESIRILMVILLLVGDQVRETDEFELDQTGLADDLDDLLDQTSQPDGRLKDEAQFFELIQLLGVVEMIVGEFDG